MRVAVQMDPLSCLSLKTDSTVALVRCALTRGHEVFVYTPQTLSLREGSLVAQGCVALSQGGVFPWESGPEQRCSLEEFQLVLVRQDPPFDMAYLTSLYLLEMLAGDVVVVNCPVGVRRSPEKIFPLVFSHLMPPTLITSSRTEAEAFWRPTKMWCSNRFMVMGVAGCCAFWMTRSIHKLSWRWFWGVRALRRWCFRPMCRTLRPGICG